MKEVDGLLKEVDGFEAQGLTNGFFDGLDGLFGLVKLGLDGFFVGIAGLPGFPKLGFAGFSLEV